MEFDENEKAVYSCVPCDKVCESGLYDGTNFDCSLTSNIGKPICGQVSSWADSLLPVLPCMFIPVVLVFFCDLSVF